MTSLVAGRQAVTLQLAQLAVSGRADAVTDDAAAAVKRTLIDYLGGAVAGAQAPASRLAAEHAREESAAGPSTVIGQGFDLSPTGAAFVNGVAGHVLETDDMGRDAGVGHPSAAIVPAALAVGQAAGSSGPALLRALVIGHEVMARIGSRWGGPTSDVYARGLHGTVVFGVLGATAVAAHLLELDVVQARNAFGLAASSAGGIRANYGTMTKALHAGDTNRTGVRAAVLARRGFTANPEALEARDGWGDAFIGAPLDQCVYTDGDSLTAIEVGPRIKPYPVCGAMHTAITCFLQLVDGDPPVPRDDIERVEVATSDRIANRALPYGWPADGLQARFSLAYGIAAAWASPDVGLDAFTEERIGELGHLRNRIVVRTDEAAPRIGPLGTAVRIRTRDGATRSIHERELRDGNRREARPGWLLEKFQSSVAGAMTPDAAAALLGAIDGLDGAASLDALATALR